MHVINTPISEQTMKKNPLHSASCDGGVSGSNTDLSGFWTRIRKKVNSFTCLSRKKGIIVHAYQIKVLPMILICICIPNREIKQIPIPKEKINKIKVKQIKTQIMYKYTK